LPCHAKGNYQQPVFDEEDDFRQHLQWLKEYADIYSLNIWAYCPMANHVHVVSVPLIVFHPSLSDVKIMNSIKTVFNLRRIMT
jgi:REP element-mobilizing transposase RayT